MFDNTMTFKPSKKSKYHNSDMTIMILSWKYNTNTNFLTSYLNEPMGYLMIVTSYLTLQSRLPSKSQNIRMKFWAILCYLTSYLTWITSSRQKVNILEFWHLHRVPRVKICIHTTFQLYLIIFGILTLFEWNFGLFYDIWRHVWR